MMLAGIYIGNRRRELFNKTALLRKSCEEGKVLAQFDALFLPEALGWHEFWQSEFVNIEKLGGN